LLNLQIRFDYLAREIGLTRERLRRLQMLKEKNPAWEAYDKYADAPVGIDIRIEEQEAVLEELADEIAGVQSFIDQKKGLNQTIPMFGVSHVPRT